jgi:Cell Wall Hydrolase
VADDIRYLTPQDRDYSIRTMLGEAADQPDNGLAAVGHVIMNRARDGSYGGSSPAAVVLSPGQFEPWQTRTRELLSYSPQSPAYVRAARIFDSVVGGDTPDPTSGATHFLNPEIVRARRGGSLPDWAQGSGQRIGDHVFYGGKASNGKVAEAKPAYQDPFIEFANGKDVVEHLKAEGGSSKAAPTDIFQEFANPEASPAPSAPGTPPRPPISGFDQNSPEVQAIQANPGVAPTPNNGGFNRDIGEIGHGIAALPGGLISQTGADFNSGKQLMESGAADIRNGNYLPSFPSSDPRTWSAGGLLKAPAGAVAAISSPFSAAATKLVAEPVTELTGNPNIGERAGTVASLIAGSKFVAPKIAATFPENRAMSGIADVLRPEDFPELAKRLRENPRLSLMDVDPNLQIKAQGLIRQTEGNARDTLTNAVEQRMAGRQDALRAANDELLGPAPNVEELTSGLRKQARDKGRELFGGGDQIGTVFQGAEPVNVSGVVSAIDKKLNPTAGGATSALPKGPVAERLDEIRSQLTNDKELLADPQRLHVIQSDLGAEINNLSKSASGTEKRLIGPLKEVQNGIVSAIDEATDGKYKPARQVYKNEMEVQEAFDKGRNLFRNRQSVDEDLPEFWKKWASDASPAELDAARKGARVALDYQVRSLRDAARRGTDLPEIGFNRDKVQILLGKKEADTWAKRVRDEADIARTNNKLIGNSETANNLAGMESVKVREPKPLSLSQYVPPVAAEIAGAASGFPEFGHVGAAALGAAAAGNRLMQSIGRRSDIARNNRLARILSSTGEDIPISDLARLISPPQSISQRLKSLKFLAAP